MREREASPPKRVKARDPSHLLWRIRDDIEIPRRPIGLARNDKRLPPLPLMAGNVGEEKCPPLSGCRERGRRRKAGEDCLSGASSAPPGGERSGRQKKTDNQRATFLGYFFAAGKKLQNAVILTTAGRKNLLPSVTASQYNVILKGFALKNLLPSEHIV